MSSALCLRVADEIHGASIKVLRSVRAEDAKSGVGPAQLSVLSILVFFGPKKMGELAEAEQVKPPTMSRVVDGLVRQGMAERVTVPGDRRALRISATLKGKRLLLAGKQRRVQALAKKLERLTQGDLSTLEKAFQILSQV